MSAPGLLTPAQLKALRALAAAGEKGVYASAYGLTAGTFRSLDRRGLAQVFTVREGNYGRTKARITEAGRERLAQYERTKA